MYKQQIRDGKATVIITSHDEVIVNENNYGVISLLKYRFNTDKELFVYDKLIGKAAALLLLEHDIVYVYAKTITTEAIGLLNGIVLEYDEEVEHILNRKRDDLCPIEKIARASNNKEELTKSLLDFYESIGEVI